MGRIQALEQSQQALGAAHEEEVAAWVKKVAAGQVALSQREAEWQGGEGGGASLVSARASKLTARSQSHALEAKWRGRA